MWVCVREYQHPTHVGKVLLNFNASLTWIDFREFRISSGTVCEPSYNLSMHLQESARISPNVRKLNQRFPRPCNSSTDIQLPRQNWYKPWLPSWLMAGSSDMTLKKNHLKSISPKFGSN